LCKVRNFLIVSFMDKCNIIILSVFLTH